MKWGLVGALVALVIVGGALALDKTTLHLYSQADTPTAIPTAVAETRWYYVTEFYARGLVARYGTRLPPCAELVGSGARALPAFPNAPPIVSAGELAPVRIAVECRATP